MTNEMTNERAKSELMQLYGSLSEEKKMALDVLVAQADGEYIKRQDAISEIREMAKWHTGDAFNADRVIQHLKQLPSVAIPPDHDGCKDCVYQDNPQDAMPCRECKHNYMDKWKAKANKVGHWVGIDEYPHEDYECDRCGYVVSTFTANIKPHEEYKFCPNCGIRMVEPQERSE